MITKCKDCIFATYYSTNVGEFGVIIQDGCKLNRIDAYRNIEIIENIKIIDTEKNYDANVLVQTFVLNNRLCNTRRTNNWANKDKSTDSALLEAQTTYTVCIDYRGEGDIEKTILSILRQEVRPQKIIIFNLDQQFSSENLKNACVNYGRNILKSCKIISYNEDFQTVLDQTLRTEKTFYYCFVKSGDVLPESILLNIDVLKNKVLKRIVAFVPGTASNIFICQGLFYYQQDMGEHEDVWDIAQNIKNKYLDDPNIMVLDG